MGRCLTPNGKMVNSWAAAAHLLRRSSPALGFDNHPLLKVRIDRDDLAVTADSVLVPRIAGPLALVQTRDISAAAIPAGTLTPDAPNAGRA